MVRERLKTQVARCAVQEHFKCSPNLRCEESGRGACHQTVVESRMCREGNCRTAETCFARTNRQRESHADRAPETASTRMEEKGFEQVQELAVELQHSSPTANPKCKKEIIQDLLICCERQEAPNHAPENQPTPDADGSTMWTAERCVGCSRIGPIPQYAFGTVPILDSCLSLVPERQTKPNRLHVLRTGIAKLPKDDFRTTLSMEQLRWTIVGSHRFAARKVYGT